MKRFTLFLLLFATACVSAEGLSPESTKPPLGNVNATVLVEEFSDLQCPACRGAHVQIVQPLLEKYGRAVRFEFHHFPLSQIHPYAQEAAEAAECAADQGKFWEFVDATFENQQELQREDLLLRAKQIGIADQDLFQRCVISRIKKDAVLLDAAEAQKRNLRGTPTFFINGEQVTRHTPEVLSQMIEDAIGGQRL